MSILVTTAKEAPSFGLRSVRVYVGFYGLVYDTLRDLWTDPARFYDRVERRGLKLEKELNTRFEQLEHEAGVSIESLRRGMQLRLQMCIRDRRWGCRMGRLVAPQLPNQRLASGWIGAGANRVLLATDTGNRSLSIDCWLA